MWIASGKGVLGQGSFSAPTCPPRSVPRSRCLVQRATLSGHCGVLSPTHVLQIKSRLLIQGHQGHLTLPEPGLERPGMPQFSTSIPPIPNLGSVNPNLGSVNPNPRCSPFALPRKKKKKFDEIIPAIMTFYYYAGSEPSVLRASSPAYSTDAQTEAPGHVTAKTARAAEMRVAQLGSHPTVLRSTHPRSGPARQWSQ
jgi:hypothetical protein